MMEKNLLFQVVLLSAIFLTALAAHEPKCPDKERLKQEFESCKVEVAGPEAKNADIMTLWQEHGSCIVKCMMGQFGILADDGKINKDFAIEMARDCQAVHTDLADKIKKVEECLEIHSASVDPSKEKCSGYSDLISCVMSQFRKGA